MSHSKRPTVPVTGKETPSDLPAATVPPANAPEESPTPPHAAAIGEEPSLSPEAIAELCATAAKVKEAQDQYLRARADLENYRKRAARERQDAIQYANESLLRALLPVLDHFEMALAAQPEGASLESLKTGVAMIHGQLRAALAEAGLQEVDATGAVFDPQSHEALSLQDSTEVPDGHVLQQVRKGYRLRDRLVRPASVIVARKPSA